VDIREAWRGPLPPPSGLLEPITAKQVREQLRAKAERVVLKSFDEARQRFANGPIEIEVKVPGK
jgi:hypothetical protein